MTEEEKQRRAEQMQAAEDKVKAMVDDQVITISESVTELAEQVKALNERHAKEDELARSVDVPGAGDYVKNGKYSISRAIGSLIRQAKMDPHYRKGAELEWEVSDATRLNGPSTSPDSAGGFIMPEEAKYEMLIEPYEKLMGPVNLGATVLSGLNAEKVDIPTVVDEFEAESVSEHGGASDQTAKFGQISMTPHTAQVITNPSREFLNGSAIAADAFLQKLIGKAIARKIAYMGFNGSNSADEPLGVLNLPGLQTVDFANSSTPSILSKPYHPNAVYNLLQMEGVLEDIDALDNEESVAWAVHPVVKRVLAGMKSENAAAGTESLEMGRKSVYDSTQKEILGRRFLTSGRGLSKGAQSTAILGDWSEMYLGLWDNMMFEASSQTERAMRHRQVMISAYQRYTWAYGRPSWFIAAKNWDLTNASAA